MKTLLIITLVLLAMPAAGGEYQDRSPSYNEPVNQDGWANLSLGIGFDKWYQSTDVFEDYELVDSYKIKPLSARLFATYVQPLDWRTSLVLSLEWVPSFQTAEYEFGPIQIDESLSRVSFSASLKFFFPRKARNALDDYDSGWESH